MEAARLRRQDDVIRDLALAWHTAAFQRQKKLPSLQRLVRQVAARTPGPPQSPAQLKSALSVLSEQYGIPLRKRNRANEKGVRRGQ